MRFYGEVQGEVMLVSVPLDLLFLHEVISKQTVRCWLTAKAWQALSSQNIREGDTIRARGMITQCSKTGGILEVEVWNLEKVEDFDEQLYRAGLGAVPDTTGGLSVEEYIRRMRDETDQRNHPVDS